MGRFKVLFDGEEHNVEADTPAVAAECAASASNEENEYWMMGNTINVTVIDEDDGTHLFEVTPEASVHYYVDPVKESSDG